MATYYYYGVESSGGAVGGVATILSVLYKLRSLNLLINSANYSYFTQFVSATRCQTNDAAGNIHIFVSGLQGAEVPYAGITYHQLYMNWCMEENGDDNFLRHNSKVTGSALFTNLHAASLSGYGKVYLNIDNGAGMEDESPAYTGWTDTNNGYALCRVEEHFLRTIEHPAIVDELDPPPDYVEFPAKPTQYVYDMFWFYAHSVLAPEGYWITKYLRPPQFATYNASPQVKDYSPQYYITQGGGGLPEDMQIKNSAGQVVDFDFTNIENKLDQIIKDSTFVAKMDAMGVSPDYTPYLQDLVNAIVEKVMFEVQNARLDENNRQLSLIDSRLHHVIPNAGIVDLIDVLQGGAGFDGKLKNPDGTPIDVKTLLEDIGTGIANGAILAGDKWEPIRGFFAMLKEKWS